MGSEEESEQGKDHTGEATSAEDAEREATMAGLRQAFKYAMVGVIGFAAYGVYGNVFDSARHLPCAPSNSSAAPHSNDLKLPKPASSAREANHPSSTHAETRASSPTSPYRVSVQRGIQMKTVARTPRH